MAENNNITNQNFPLSFNSYAAFDATSMKTLMQQRLIEGGVFTDQIFEGSNFNSLLDVIAYSYHVLLFYLNRTANESSFTTSQLYENVNKIVKILNYNPIGIQTSVISFSAAANSDLPIGIYTVPRYAYFTINDLAYSFVEDVTFTKSESGFEVLNDLNESALLYQGSFVQYPLYIATGESFEELTLVSVDQNGNNELIDHNNVHVYVKPSSEPWRQFKNVNNLFLENPISESFELRLNENQRYVIKFGDGITGKKLNEGDVVAIYYLRSDGVNGEIGSNSLNGSRMFLYNSVEYNEIMSAIRFSGMKILNINEALRLNFTNTLPSSRFTFQEDVNSMKKNATNTYKTQYRLINSSDFENYILKNFSNLIQDVKAIDNTTYTNEHMKYYFDLGLSQPNLDSRVMFNQINFGNSCSFNNINLYCIPRVPQNENAVYNRFLNLGLKNKIKDMITPLKVITSEIVFQDPVYVSLGLGVATTEEITTKKLYPEIISETKLHVNKTNQSFISNQALTENIINLFKAYFDNLQLGKYVNIDQLNSSLYQINGVDSFYTQRVFNNQNITVNGLSFLIHNPVYNSPNEDIFITTQSIQLPYFKSVSYEDYDVLRKNIIIN
jgi:hypothetical protein